MPADTLLTAVRAHLNLEPTHKVLMEPIQKGASGRTIIRIKPEGYMNLIGVHYTLDRSDNANYLPVGQFLESAGLNVPEVLYDNIGRHVALVEDLGDIDLTSLKGKPWEVREPYYRCAFEQLDKLLYTRPPKDFALQPKFDAAMYQWEQEYFIEHFVETHLEKDGTALREDPILAGLSKRLGATSPHMVHRDYQSQNLLLKDGKCYVIDFQGLRMGRQEYDLASLLYDPYMAHTAEDREKMLELWEEVTEDTPIEPILKDCAVQRLMQALGAFANLGHNQNNEWYLEQIPAAVAGLKKVIHDTPLEDSLKEYL
ncbi:phosphotransferase [Akkermansiaceae bacterium]|jgi:aminoglycoside/choline kinase family phosphotransferase|nr:phosphotransferase [Akkermansiaceae bacterium]|tara:strand:- start:1358 stop:2296 length:939 start_codon:yes stop_codon:yes gene_type:complete